MFYATAGQQATQQPPSTRGAMGTFKAGPPGFGMRNAAGGSSAALAAPKEYAKGGLISQSDPSDFPALGSHLQHNSGFSQTQHSQPSTTGQQNTHLQQQQLYLQQRQQLGVTPPPPPGISGPPSASQTNGALQDDFPVLGADGKDRMASYLRNPSNVHQPTPPSPPNTLPNGAAAASAPQSVDATPSSNPSHPQSNAAPPSTTESWQRQSPRSMEPVVRPVQQIMSSPVDKWGLKALLYEIQVHMNKTDRGMMVFGEDLEELGMDVNSEEPLYPTFVIPWADLNSLLPPQIEESFHIPQCYFVHAPPVETKLQNFAEDTLFFAFYMSAQDVLQLRVAEELYARGWRYHIELQIWLTSPTLASIDLTKADRSSGQPNWIRGPFVYLDTRTWVRQRTAEDFTIDAYVLEVTRRAEDVIREESMKKDAQKSPNGSMQGPQTQQAQGQGLPYQR
nr:CCR4-NOT transcription complex subunit 2 [Cryptococcus depauperatus CBS 7841]